MGPPSTTNVALTITETDEVETPLATYVYSESTTERRDAQRPETEQLVRKGRLDIVGTSDTPGVESSWTGFSIASILTSLVNVFLPAGYPHSVSEDYLQYQIYSIELTVQDSVQAFSSSIAGLLSSRAVLQGVGVGDAAASPTSALLLHILQDSSGRIATILFAHRLGTALEPECKMYRLAADVFNDVAMILDCVSPVIGPRPARFAVLSGAGVLRALCGVSGGSSKASLSAHFAKWGNIGELNAKDSSQETIISLLGMLVGSFVVSYITSPTATWISLILLLCLHLSANYRAVRAVQMTSLNRQRANIVFSTLLNSDPDLHTLIQEEESARSLRSSSRSGKGKTASQKEQLKFLRPSEVAERERIFERDGVLRWRASSSTSSTTTTSSKTQKLGFCRIGCSLQGLASLVNTHSPTITLPQIIDLFKDEHYLLAPTTTPPIINRAADTQITIVLKKGCTTIGQLKAWTHALLVAYLLNNYNHNHNRIHSPNDHQKGSPEMVLDIIASSLSFLNEDHRFEEYTSGLVERGWDLDVAALETIPGRRVQIMA